MPTPIEPGSGNDPPAQPTQPTPPPSPLNPPVQPQPTQDTFPADYVRELRDENKARRLELTELRERFAKLEARQTEPPTPTPAPAKPPAVKKGSSDDDALAQYQQEMEALRQQNAQLAEQQRQLQQSLIDSQRQSLASAAAAKAGVANPRDLNVLAAVMDVDMSKPIDQIERDIAERVNALKTTHGYLFQFQGAQLPTPTPQVASFSPAGGGGAPLSDSEKVRQIQQRAGRGGLFTGNPTTLTR